MRTFGPALGRVRGAAALRSCVRLAACCAVVASACASRTPPLESPRCAAAVTSASPPASGAAALHPAPFLDPEITDAVTHVETARLRADVDRLAAFGTRHALSEAQHATRGVGAAARWLRSRFDEISAASGGRLQVRVQDFEAPAGPRVPRPWPMQNVLAVLPGRATGAAARSMVVSGHYDSRATDIMDATHDAPGANDDASGVALVLEACRVLSAHEHAATLVFAAVSGEEQGLFGSRALAAELARSGARVAAMFTDDIVGSSRAASGRADLRRVRVFSAGLPADAALREKYLAIGGESDGPARELARAVDEAARAYVSGFEVMLVERVDRFLRGGDHLPFHEAGVPALRFTEVEEDFRHQHQDVRQAGGVSYGDLPELVDAAYLANVTRVNVAALAVLARAPEAPRDVRVDVRDLAEDTTLVWLPDADESVEYEVVARPTGDNVWRRTFAAGRTGRVTVPVSKDHFIVALRARDARGHTSPATLPMPLRTGDPWPPPALGAPAGSATSP